MAQRPLLWLLALAIVSECVLGVLGVALQRPTAAYAPLYTGLVKLADVPEFAAPSAPPLIAPVGRRRRLDGYPAAPELSAEVLERKLEEVAGGARSSSPSGGGARRRRERLRLLRRTRRRRQLLERSSDTASSSSGGHGGGTPAAVEVFGPHDAARNVWLPPHDEATVAAEAAAAATPTTEPPNSRTLLQSSGGSGTQQPQPQQRPGWTGLWWADAGGVGVAVGPQHVVHTIGTALAIYAIDPATGAAATGSTPQRVVALQDLFAPVGAGNCRDGVIDGVPLFDKHARRWLVAATCAGKGAVLLAASVGADPTGSWFLFTLLADAADTGIACEEPRESAVADAARLTYDANGVYVSAVAYCPSRPSVRGALLLALPKAKVYKGAPNHVFAVFGADQIAAALPAKDRAGDGAGDGAIRGSDYRQCAPAPPQTAADAAAAHAAYFVCDHVGPDSDGGRTSFTLVRIGNTGALWQFAGARETSPSPLLQAALVPRGKHAPLDSDAFLRQPEQGADLLAGGTKPAGFWSGAAVLRNGRVYVVDRVDVTHAPPAPAAPYKLPSLAWAEVAVTAKLTGGGDCVAGTSAWGSQFSFDKDFSANWGWDFDASWRESQGRGQEMQNAATAFEDAVAAAMANCTAAAAASGTGSAFVAAPPSSAAVTTEISDGSVATVDPFAAAAGSGGGGGFAAPPQCSHDAIAAAIISGGAANGNAPASGSSSGSGGGSGGKRRLLAGVDAAALDRAAGAWQRLVAAAARNGQLPPELAEDGEEAAAAAALGGDAADAADTAASSGGGRRKLQQSVVRAGLTLPGWDGLQCWYCYGGNGFFYSSGWYYRYWNARGAWSNGWWRRYRRNYAPGWSKPSKFGVGRRRRQLLQEQAQAQADGGGGDASGGGVDASGGPAPPKENVIIPPCLLGGVDYVNTCKACNYTNLDGALTVSVLRSGLVTHGGPDPLGLAAPAIAVAPGGAIVIVTAYSGPRAHPNSQALAYPGIATITVPPPPASAGGGNGTGGNSTQPPQPPQQPAALWRVLRTGAGKVRSPTGRWSDFSSVELAGGGGAPGAAAPRLHFGVQWAQRVVDCPAGEPGDGAFLPTCAMPAPWLGYMAPP